MRIKSLFVFAVVVAIGVIAASPQAQAGTINTYDATTACSNSDLLQTQFVSFEAGGPAPGSQQLDEMGTEPSVRDGVAYTSALWPAVGPTAVGYYTGGDLQTWTYTLDTSTNTLGYDLSQVNLFIGWGGLYRQEFAVKVEFSTVGDETFHTLYDMGTTTYDPPSDYGEISIQSATADNATGVKKVKITFNYVDHNWGGVSELDVVGTPTPEPATMALMALGGLGLLLKRRRR